LTTDCGVDQSAFWFAVVNWGDNDTSYQFDVSIMAVPQVVNINLSPLGTVVNNTLTSFQTVYYSLTRTAESVVADAITIIVNSLDGGLYHVMLTNLTYPGSDSCTLSQCWSSTSCNLTRYEECQTGDSTTVTIGVKLATPAAGKNSSSFQMSVVLNRKY
jgi:hypothetical protein